MRRINPERRRLFQLMGLLTGLLGIKQAEAHHVDTHFEEQAKHRIVYQCNKAEPEYLAHILFSVGEMIRKHGDDVEVVVACFGPGIHLLGHKPERPVPIESRRRAASLASYGVRFHACKNTMDSLGWGEADIFNFARIVPIGVEDIMLLQEQGFSYFSW